jgi:hypothetical protein
MPEIVINYRKQRLILPRRDVMLLPLENTSTELLAEYVGQQIRRKIKRKFPSARIRFMQVGVEEARGQRGVFCGEF